MKLPAPLRTLVADLVERKLWPVALLLLVAIAAFPVYVMAGSSDEAPVADVAAAPAVGEAAAVQPAADEEGVSVDGKARDPFTQPKVKTTPAPAAKSDPAPSSSGPSSGSGSTGGASPASGLDKVGVVPVGGSTGGTSTGSTGSDKSDDQGDDKAKPNKDSWHVDIRFGKNGSALTTKNDVPRLSPLPSQDDPFFVYLGVAADGKTAMFLVSSDATATGDGTCKPNPENCERVDMQAGDTEFFDVTTPEGEIIQYELDLVRISRKVSASAAVASAARARESQAGREVLRQAVETKQVDVSDLAYSPKLGLVIPTGAGEQNSALFGGYRVDLQFGAPGQLVKRYNLARLTPLPSVEDPSFVFLGVLADGRTALFLNPTEAAAAGDAVCEPSPEQCQRVKLETGKTASLVTQTVDGATSEYQMTIDGITPVQADTPEEAAASRHRESPAGRVVLRRLITEVGSLVGDLTFSGGKGVVEPAQPAE